MLKEHARAVAVALRSLDLAVLAGAFPVAHALRSAAAHAAGSRLAGLYPMGRYAGWIALALLFWIAAAGAVDLYRPWRTRSLREELGGVARAAGAVLLLLSATGRLTGDRDVSRLLLVTWLALALLGLVAGRLAIRSMARSARRRGYNVRTFAVVGSGPLAREMRRLLLARPQWGFRFAGFVLEDDVPLAELPGPVLGRVRELPAILERSVIDLVAFAVTRERLAQMEAAVAACEEQGTPAKIALDLFPGRRARLSVEELEGVPVLSYASTPQDVLALAMKRALDVAVSALGLVVLSPVLAAIAVAVRLGSPGPVLFRQRRVGQSGRAFTLYKFRSMRLGAERQKAGLLGKNEADGPVFKLSRDPRVTPIGRWLRRASLDELPQLWNVLRGDMSLVGPRPPLPEEVERYERWQRRRLSVKPGLTCTWQVSGRSDIGFRRWVELDLAYIDEWSLWQDVRIVLRTIPAVLLGRGAR